MASPFSVFRRNQKIMLAIVGIGAMVAFVFLDPLMRYVGGSAPRSENPVVVETRFGDLRARELDSLRYQRQMVELFLERLLEQSVVKQFGQTEVDSRWLSGMVQQQYFVIRQRLMGRSVGTPEADAVETMVLAERAKQMGLIITDQMINDVIKQVSGDSLTPSEVQNIVRSLQPQRPMSVSRLFDALRMELLASQYRDMFAQSISDVPPGQRFDYYSRLNREAKAEVLSLAVADFIGQVPDPSDAEIKEFYDKFKDRLPDPTSPEPGFREPKRATFQYFKANVDQLTEKLKDEITDEEVAKYYEENKRNFIATSFDDLPQDDAGEETEMPAEDSQAPLDQNATEQPTTSADTIESSESEPAAAPESDEQPASDAEISADEKPQATDGARLNRAFRSAGQVFRLASTLTQEEDPAAAEDQAADPTTEAKPESEVPASEAQEPSAVESSDRPTDPPASDPGDEVVEEPQVPQYEPLEKVADTIRDTLAREKAAEQLSEQFEELSSQMRRFTDDYDIYTTEKGTNPNAKPPVPLNFADLAEGKDVEPLELKSVSPLQVAREDIGRAFRIVTLPSGGTRTIPFIDVAFSDSQPTFKPEIDRDNDSNYYLYWKTEEEPSYVPPLDQIREQVVRAWKLIKARDLARQRGEEFAAQAKTLDKPLTETFGQQPGVKVTELPPFTWLTLGSVPSQAGGVPRLTEIDELDQAGDAFMRTVFNLPAGGTGVSFNVPEDTVFVVRVSEFEPEMDELRDQFARENPNRYLEAARDDRIKMYSAWIADLNKDADVRWRRPADTRRNSSQNDEEY